MRNEIAAPESILRLVADKPYQTDSLGMSGAKIYLFDDRVLKVERASDENARTVEMMRWLAERVPTPKVLACERADGFQYLLMSRARGRMACDEYFLERPDELVSLLAEALKALWRVDISDCPRRRPPSDELAEARARVEAGLVDVGAVEPETFGEGGFESPAALLEWLEKNRPPLEPALSHGDFCLPNIFFDGDKVSCFIDLDRTAVADRWKDIALCYRSLRHNAEGAYGGKVYPNLDPDLLFEKLGIEPNWEKIRYYILMDELF